MTSNKEPQVGDGATFTIATDSHACTIIEVNRNGREVVLQQDRAIRTDNNGMSDCQDYRFERNPNGALYRVSKRTLKNGKGEIIRVVWKQVGHPTRSPGCYASLGGRHEYHDFSF